MEVTIINKVTCEQPLMKCHTTKAYDLVYDVLSERCGDFDSFEEVSTEDLERALYALEDGQFLCEYFNGEDSAENIAVVEEAYSIIESYLYHD